MHYFVTGTDTGVGKTRVSCAIVREWRARGLDCVGLKPIACGDRDDAIALREAAAGTLSLARINPVWLQTPAAPYLASTVENRAIDPATIRRSIARVQSEHASVIVEGVGGWLVPITREYTIADFATDLRLSVIVVVANRLGAINHTMLTVRAIRNSGLHCAGLIFNEPTSQAAESMITAGNRMVLKEMLNVPILGDLAFGEETIQWKIDLVSAKATQ